MNKSTDEPSIQRTEGKGPALQAQIDRTDNEIDRMVYALYGLEEEEVAVVEGRG